MRQLNARWNFILGIVCLLLFFFVLYTGLTLALHPLPQGAICVGLALIIVFILYPARKKSKEQTPGWLDIGLAVLTIPPCVYVSVNWYYIVMHTFRWTPTAIAFGTILLLLALEAVRRTLGWTLLVMIGALLGYTFLGQYIPGFWGHAGFKFEYVINMLYQTGNGFWGVVTWSLAGIVPLFIIFAPVLFGVGGANLLMALAKWVGTKITGGAAMTAVVASAFFGMISGSPIANAMTVGSFTIPAMKKTGYTSEFAAAVEAAASTGGMITPPIMAVTGFIIAEYLSLPYVDIMIAAVIPAFIYYWTCGTGIFFYAKARNIGKFSESTLFDLKKEMKWRPMLITFLPIGILTYLLVIQAPAAYCAGVALVAIFVCYMIFGGRYSIAELKKRLFALTTSIIEGIKAYGWIMAVCFGTQIIVALFSYTGLATKFSSTIIGLREMNLMVSLILSLILVLILGMGVPAVAAYLIGFSVIGSALTQLGITPLQAHFFVFYCSILGNITPPVCLAVFATAKLAEANWVKTGFICCGLTFTSICLVPFLICLYPGLLMQGDPLSIVTITAKVALCVLCFQSVFQLQFLLKRINMIDLILLSCAGMTMLMPAWYPVIGTILMILVFVSQKYEWPRLPYLSHRFSVVKLTDETEGRDNGRRKTA